MIKPNSEGSGSTYRDRSPPAPPRRVQSPPSTEPLPLRCGAGVISKVNCEITARGRPLSEAEIKEVRRAPAHAPTPASCNTGVKNRDQGALQCAGTHSGATAPGSPGPEDYFNSLRIDTLKLSAEVASESIRRLGMRWVEEKRSSDPENPSVVTAHDGTELEVKAHDPNDNRSVLMVGEGVEVTAVPKGQTPVPFVGVEFGASWCWNHSPEELTEWARKFCEHFGMVIERALVSRMDACTDVDERFYRTDVGRFEGEHRGALSGTVTFSGADDSFTGLRYERSTHRPLTFRVYDKRAEVDTRDGHTFWNEVWKAHDIAEGTPVWRVEFEAQRPRLRERGITTWEDLTEERIERFWTYCTGDFARMDRELWSSVQGASTQDAADRATVEPQFDPEHLQRQADGCVESAAEGNRTSKAEELARLVERQDDATQEELNSILNAS